MSEEGSLASFSVGRQSLPYANTRNSSTPSSTSPDRAGQGPITKYSNWSLQSVFHTQEHFKLSHIGLSCRNPVNETKKCQEAASLAKIEFLTADEIEGNLADLPYGCIFDKVTQGFHYTYWNPNGVAISADPNIRQICQEQDISPSSEGNKTGFILFWH